MNAWVEISELFSRSTLLHHLARASGTTCGELWYCGVLKYTIYRLLRRIPLIFHMGEVKNT